MALEDRQDCHSISKIMAKRKPECIEVKVKLLIVKSLLQMFSDQNKQHQVTIQRNICELAQISVVQKE